MTNEDFIKYLINLDYSRGDFIIYHKGKFLINAGHHTNAIGETYSLKFVINPYYDQYLNSINSAIIIMFSMYLDNSIQLQINKNTLSKSRSNSNLEIHKNYILKDISFSDYINKNIIHQFLKLYKLQHSKYTNNLKSSFNLIDIDFNIITKDLDIEYELKIEGIKKIL